MVRGPKALGSMAVRRLRADGRTKAEGTIEKLTRARTTPTTLPETRAVTPRESGTTVATSNKSKKTSNEPKPQAGAVVRMDKVSNPFHLTSIDSSRGD